MANQGWRDGADPTTKEYSLPGGRVFLSFLDVNDKEKGFFDMGNCPEVTLSVEIDTYKHYDVRNGKQGLDMSAVILQDMNLSFTCENSVFDNLQLFFAGKKEEFINPVITGITDVPLVIDGELRVNRWYRIVDADGNPCFDVGTVSSIVITSTETVPTVLVKDTDYTVNEVTGMVFIKDTTTVQDVITAEGGLEVTLAANAEAPVIDSMSLQSVDQIIVALRIEQKDAVTGEKRVLDIHKCNISANGEINLISPTEVTPIPMNGAVEKNSNYVHVADYYTTGGVA